MSSTLRNFNLWPLCLRGWLGLLGFVLHLAGPAAAQLPAVGAHCLMLPLEPARRVQLSALIVEARVRDAHSFWDAGHHRLFTRHRLQVFSLLKGQPADTAGLTLLTEGGRLGLDQQILTNTLQLVPGQQGVFFLMPALWPGLPPGGHLLAPVASQQGFIEVNPADGTAAEPFRTYPALDAVFYQQLASLTGQARRVLQPLPAPTALAARPAGTQAPVVTSLSPLGLPAGVGAVLTISGSGFGSSRGTGFVEFRNADDGGATRVKARDADYLTWTDTRIQVRVPSAASGGHPAGSGLVRVTTDGQLPAESPLPVTVVYALTNVESTDGTILQRPNHIAQNASGGLSFQLGPNFGAGPSAAWQRALASWRCSTGMNWDGAAGSSNAIADDGVNVVAFDQSGAQLPAQVLGRTTSYYRGCYAPDGSVTFWVKEIDMQFDDATNFQFGPALAVSPQIDFETVAVHELGHAQQLGHLILPGAVMHYAVARGQNARTLSAASDIAGGRQVLRVRSFRNLGCGGPALLPAPLTALAASYTEGVGGTLTWSTRDECFLSSFAIERSAGLDTTSWQRVGTVATRPPAAAYSFVDAQVPAGLHYYRLRLLRPDNSLDNAAPVLLSSTGNTVGVFPNPVAGDALQLQYPAAASGTVSFRFYDGAGRLVRATALSVPAGFGILTLDVGGLCPGLYLLRWLDAQGGTGSRKFVRQ